jgi:hypothetical protein
VNKPFLMFEHRIFPEARNGIVTRDDSAVTPCKAVFLLYEALALTAADVIRAGLDFR